MTPDLISAIDANNTALVKELLKRGADVEAADKDGNSALMHAMEKGLEIVSLLVERGADPHRKNIHGLSPRQYIADPLQLVWNNLDSRDVIKILDEAPERRRSFLVRAEENRRAYVAENQRRLQQSLRKIKLKPGPGP